MKRRSKIVATLGPATDAEGVLDRLIEAGVDVVRLNFSHGKPADHEKRVNAVREAGEKHGRNIGILADLQGPKIRTEDFKDGPVTLVEGETFTLDAGLASDAGNESEVGITYKKLPDDVNPGDTLLLADGILALKVEDIDGTRVVCRVMHGGVLSNRKGINRLGGGLSAEALTEKDRRDIETAAGLDVDFVAVSFPRDAEDMHAARALVEQAAGHSYTRLVAKIERAEAIVNLEEVIAASDAVMVARGDLGVEIGDEELPGVQKKIIALSREMNRMVITATQMLESMIENPIPTRAEVLDVANAVIDGTDAVMLSAESAAGKYPVRAVLTMARVCQGAERHDAVERSRDTLERHFERSDEAVAMATIYTARNMHAQAIIALTESGNTALWMSRSAFDIPIFALTRHARTLRQMAMCRGVLPVSFTPSSLDALVAVKEAVDCLKALGRITDGDRVLITKGDFTGPGGTNAMKIITVGQMA